MTTSPTSTPRNDYYQTESLVIVSLYVKGYSVPELRDDVSIAFESNQVSITLPALGDNLGGAIQLGPLYGKIDPTTSSHRLLSSKIELKLAKMESGNWPSLLVTANSQPNPSTTSTPTRPQIDNPVVLKKKGARNWDKVVDEELAEGNEGKDPNAGGDAALQELFAGIYKDADADTRRAMIKSYTESGGTTLSTDWNSIGKETTPIRPPDGMEARMN